MNTHEHDDHVFHIHTNPFVIVKLNDKPLAKPQWRDTAIVERKSGALTFRSRFLDYTGIFMLHCHMMNHEEMGMMQTVEVYRGRGKTHLQRTAGRRPQSDFGRICELIQAVRPGSPAAAVRHQ